MSKLGDISTLIINGNELAIKDEALTEIVNEIIEAIAINNTEISEHINNLNNRAFDANIKISSANESEISNIQDGLYKIQYVTVTGSGDNATETLNNSAILIQKGTNQYLYKDGLLHSRAKENNVWGDWITYEGIVTSVNGKTGDIVLELEDIKPHDYSGDYLTTIALEDGTFTFSTNAVSYSLDNAETWIELPANTASPTVTAGKKIMWKGELTPSSSNGIGTFSATGNFDVQGNVMSLLYEDNYKGQTDLTGKNRAFYRLFKNNTKVVNAENLSLPATTLASTCYSSMFYGCTSLINAPELPATTLAGGCYEYMFNGCTSLVNAPELPAMTLASDCYCYMFNGCTSLVTAPKLPATTLASSCYESMFMRCTSLVTIPELPATTLTGGCYSNMFVGCTSLVTAPELPATTLARGCYEYMFSGCTSLNYVKAMFTTTPSTTYTDDWLGNVASTGTFVKNDNATWNVSGAIGVPEGWSIYTESEYKEVKHYEISSLNVSHSFVKNIIAPVIIWIDDFSGISIQEMYDNYVDDNAGYKKYRLTQDTITIDNVNYYIWKNDDGDYDGSKAYLLTTTNDYDELLSQSLNEDLNNDFTSFGGFLNEDSKESYATNDSTRIQYILNVKQDNENLYIYVDNIRLTGFGDEQTIEDYIDDPETCGCNPYKLTGNTIDIDGESYYIWERTDDENHDYSTVHYLLTTTNDRETLLSTSVEANPNNLVVKPNNCIFTLMNEDNEIYKTSSKNVIVKVE